MVNEKDGEGGGIGANDAETQGASRSTHGMIIADTRTASRKLLVASDWSYLSTERVLMY